MRQFLDLDLVSVVYWEKSQSSSDHVTFAMSVTKAILCRHCCNATWELHRETEDMLHEMCACRAPCTRSLRMERMLHIRFLLQVIKQLCTRACKRSNRRSSSTPSGCLQDQHVPNRSRQIASCLNHLTMESERSSITAISAVPELPGKIEARFWKTASSYTDLIAEKSFPFRGPRTFNLSMSTRERSDEDLWCMAEAWVEHHDKMTLTGYRRRFRRLRNTKFWPACFR